jgi:alanine dehydrogenase
MELTQTLLLKRRDVAELLTIDECITAVEKIFRLHAEGKTLTPKVLGIHTINGGFHIKAGILESERIYFAAKVNANFPNNSKQYGLPTIQGIIVVCDGGNGRLLALVDSIEITIIRSGAATAVAAKYLALQDAKTITICGCGNQGRISLKALMKVRNPEKVFAFDIDKLQAEEFTRQFAREIEVIPVNVNNLGTALRQSEIVVTCTTSSQPFIRFEDIMPGTFIAAVGADSDEKQEIEPMLIASNKLVVDLTEQCANIGELHHVLQNRQMQVAGVDAELGEIIAGLKPGRTTNEEIIIFDSTGIALQDVVAASIVYEKALSTGIGVNMNFNKQGNNAKDDLVLKK